MSSPTTLTGLWEPLTPPGIAELLGGTPARWWLSGGAALDHWLGRSIRSRTNVDVSVLRSGLAPLIVSLPGGISAWTSTDRGMVRLSEIPQDAEVHPVYLRDDVREAWVLQLNVEDGTDSAWIYKRDPRLQVPWARAVHDIDGVPTGAPEIQLVWKALRPRPEDDVDKDAVLPHLSDEARTWWERAILSLHPHSSWSIQVRSPLSPGKASWNKKSP